MMQIYNYGVKFQNCKELFWVDGGKSGKVEKLKREKNQPLLNFLIFNLEPAPKMTVFLFPADFADKRRY
jgi:hypothetical protein